MNEKNSHYDEKTMELKRELDAALEIIKNNEAIIADLRLEQSNNLKQFTHDLASPLQILSMTIESLQDMAPPEMTSKLDRMKRSADNMINIINSIRKLREATAGKFPTNSL